MLQAWRHIIKSSEAITKACKDLTKSVFIYIYTYTIFSSIWPTPVKVYVQIMQVLSYDFQLGVKKEKRIFRVTDHMYGDF